MTCIGKNNATLQFNIYHQNMFAVLCSEFIPLEKSFYKGILFLYWLFGFFSHDPAKWKKNIHLHGWIWVMEVRPEKVFKNKFYVLFSEFVLQPLYRDSLMPTDKDVFRKDLNNRLSRQIWRCPGKVMSLGFKLYFSCSSAKTPCWSYKSLEKKFYF